MKPQFKLIDFFQVAPDRKLSSLSTKEKVSYIDSLFESENQSGGLAVSWYLSHSGRRINNRIYTVKGQRDGIDSIIKPYAKPILTHHDQEKDPIGRFTGGRWESLASEAMGFFPSLNSYMDMQLAFDRDDPEMIFDLMNRNNLLTNRQWAGMGRMSVSAKISDPTAIEKFMDGRYITFSAGSTTDRHVCSICQSDWAVGDFCDHRHGKMYDGVPCCFVTGKFEVLEASVVNTPADDLSQLQSMEMTDSVENFSLDLKQDVSTLYFSDSIYEAQRNETLETKTQVSFQNNQNLNGKEEEEEEAKQKSSLFDGSKEEGLQQEVLEDKEYDHMLKISSSQMKELHNSGNVDILQTSGNEKMIIRVVYEGYEKEEDSLSNIFDEIFSDEKKFKVPSGARGNARKVLEWKKKYRGDVKGMTSVGWARARQLASQSEISLATVKKMAGFNRHRKNAAVDPKFKSEPWKDRGYVAWLGWGGTSGIDWAIKISAANDSLSSDFDVDKNTKSKELIMELDNAEEVVPSEAVETEEVTTDSKETQPIETNNDSSESLTQEDSDLPVEASEATKKQVAQDESLTDSTEKTEKVIAEDCVETENTQDIKDNIDIDWDIFDLALRASMQDAALSTEQRNKLPDSAFCGPNRSFPVSDCAHVTAARRLIGRAKLSDAQKAKVLACVNEKANSMSCDEEKDGALTELQRDYSTALAKVEDLEKKLETALEFVAKYNKKEISFEKDDNKLEVLVKYFDSICKEENGEAKSTPMAVVENPSVNSSDVVTVSKKVAKLGNFEKSVIDNYNLIVERDGLNAAEKFLGSQGRYLPRGFHPSKL
jgi:hypothetical protein